jgi:hypothetical protein
MPRGNLKGVFSKRAFVVVTANLVSVLAAAQVAPPAAPVAAAREAVGAKTWIGHEARRPFSRSEAGVLEHLVPVLSLIATRESDRWPS